MKLSEYIINFIANQGVTHVFGYPGGAITHLLDSLYEREDVVFVGTCHEQAAAFAAEGYARIKNHIGVAIATSGPGATNLITGIANSFFDSIPVLFITGQVNTYEYKGKLKTRQLGFQETDIVSIVKPITKYAVQITNASMIRYELEKAVYIAENGRPGPVLVDIPMNIQRADINIRELEGYTKPSEKESVPDKHIRKVIQLLNSALRPVVLIGGGVRLANACGQLDRFLQRTKIPTVSTLMGLDAYDNNAENYFGLIGAYGNRYGNFILANCDLLLVLGSRLDSRQTGTRIETFARGARVIRVDIDADELERKIKPQEMQICSGLHEFLMQLNRQTETISNPSILKWLARSKEYKQKYHKQATIQSLDPNCIMQYISALAGDNEIFCLDVGQNQIWAAQSLSITRGQRLLTSGGLGPMGFSVPAAIGAYFADPTKTIVALVGDGGLQMNIQELQTIKRNSIPIKIIVMNNHCLGMIRHFQEMYFDKRYEGTIKGYSTPDFHDIAQSYGIQGETIHTIEDMASIQRNWLKQQPMLFDIQLCQTTYVFPKLAVNAPIEDQEPLLERKEFLSNMIIPVVDAGDNRNE